MRIDEFNKWLESQPLEDKMVRLRYKYSHEDRWTYSNEYLECDMSVKGCYIWLYDWDEGQEDIEILGCVDIDKLVVPLFKGNTIGEWPKDIVYRDTDAIYCYGGLIRKENTND